jgi:oligopeptide transport system ATP-binding protein
VHTTETGHYAKCHYCGDAEFVAANAPETSRTKLEHDTQKKGGEA